MVFLGNSPNGEDKHISRKNKNVHKNLKRGNKLKDLVENTYMLHSSPRLKNFTEILTNGCFVADNMDRKDVCNALKTVNVLRKL